MSRFTRGGLSGPEYAVGRTGTHGTNYVNPYLPGDIRPSPTPWAPNQTISFVGSLTNGSQSTFFSFDALAGSSSPTITGGWAKINTIDRPRSLGFTIPVGFDPLAMDVPIQFEGVVNYKDASDIEGDIQKLEWMAGRGKLFATRADHGVGRAATGDPPLVTVASHDGTNETDLIPRSAQGIQWLVSGISYDTNPIRNSSMRRIRQLATVSLLEYVGAPDATFDSPSVRARGRNSNSGGFQTVYSNAALHNVKLLVEHHTNKKTDAVMRTVLAFNRDHGIRLKSALAPLKAHTKILIPSNLAD